MKKAPTFKPGDLVSVWCKTKRQRKWMLIYHFVRIMNIERFKLPDKTEQEFVTVQTSNAVISFSIRYQNFGCRLDVPVWKDAP